VSRASCFKLAQVASLAVGVANECGFTKMFCVQRNERDEHTSGKDGARMDAPKFEDLHMHSAPLHAIAMNSKTAMTTQKVREQHSGFTLTELLIVLAVVAILALLALPNYQAQIRKGHRAAAQSYLMDLAQRQAQYLLTVRAYASTEAALGYTTPPTVAPYYTIDIAAPVASAPAFTITATAISAQVADGDLTIDNQGTKTPADKW